VVYVDEARCTGCGLCADPCPTGAISIVDGAAHVEQSLCHECEVCLSACSNVAILAVREPAGAGRPALVRVPDPAAVRVRTLALAPRPSSGLWPWLGTALAFVGRGGGYPTGWRSSRTESRGDLGQRSCPVPGRSPGALTVLGRAVGGAHATGGGDAASSVQL